MHPILLHIPHSSVQIPDEVRSCVVLSDVELASELRVMTDAFTDVLFTLDGVDRLVFPVSRLIVDPERFRNDCDEPMSAIGMGAIYTNTHDGKLLKAGFNRENLLEKFYDPYHAKLEEWATLALATYGRCLIIDCHSFPSQPLPCDQDQSIPRPDACVGTDAFHTPPALVDATSKTMNEFGWTFAIDHPYAGSMVPASRYLKDLRVSTIMIEVSRKLYMNELDGNRNPSWKAAHLATETILASIADFWRAMPQ